MKTRLRLLLSSAALTVVSSTAMALPADGIFRLCNVDEMGTAYSTGYDHCRSQGASDITMTGCTVNSYGAIVFSGTCDY